MRVLLKLLKKNYFSRVNSFRSLYKKPIFISMFDDYCGSSLHSCCLVNAIHKSMKTKAFSISVTRSSGTSGYPRFGLTPTSDVSYSTCFTIGLKTSISTLDECLEGNNPLCAARKALVRAICLLLLSCAGKLRYQDAWNLARLG